MPHRVFYNQQKAQNFVKTLIRQGYDPGDEIKTRTAGDQYIVEYSKNGLFGSGLGWK